MSGPPQLLEDKSATIRKCLGSNAGAISRADKDAALLSVLSDLKRLSLKFQSPQSYPDLESRRPPPSKRSVIPSLTRFFFKGVTEYLEDLVSRIDAPQLNYLRIIFFNQID